MAARARERESTRTYARFRLGGILLGILLLGGCVSTSVDLAPKPPAEPVTCPPAPPLAALEAGRTPDLAQIQTLDTGREAFLARAALIEAATCSIDAQYYIWNSDASGRYLAGRLVAAADRGVRVRVLIDDMTVGDRDSALVALAAHRNVEVQVYNPFLERRGIAWARGFVREFTRLNRRMHVKSFTVDRSVTIIGGRNIGDEYFDANPEINFRDRDLLAAGPVVAQTQAMFDVFWNWTLSRPIGELDHGASAPDQNQVQALLLAAIARMSDLHDAPPLGGEEGLRYLRDALPPPLLAPARLVYDPPPDPDAMDDSDRPQPGSMALMVAARDVQSDMLVESAYLVLDDVSLDNVQALRARGVRVRALTNSLASNDVTANHAAYARRRKRMLQSGLELYELRPDAVSCRTIIRNDEACAEDRLFGLHAKTVVLDRRLVYVGSLNLNMRSRYFNAESGLIIDSPELGERIAADIELNMEPDNSWRVGLDDRGRVRWQEGGDRAGSVELTYHHEPRTGWWRRVRSRLIAMMPLEKYL